MALANRLALVNSFKAHIVSPAAQAEALTFLSFIETDLNHRLRDRRMQTRVVATTDCEHVALPSDWLEAIRVAVVGQPNAMDFGTVDELRSIAGANVAGPPTHYTIYGTTLEIAPAPSDGGTVDIEMIYYASIPVMAKDTDTTWLLKADPLLYLDGMMWRGLAFLGDDRADKHVTLYGDKISAMNVQTKISTHSGAPLVRRRRGFG